MNNLPAGRRVLVVEDEMLVLMNIEDMLAELGCASVSAANVDQALALIDTQTFDAAMLDVNLNGSNSYPIADALAARGVPFLFSTGYGAQRLNDAYRGSPVLGKPYRSAELAEALTRLLLLPLVESYTVPQAVDRR